MTQFNLRLYLQIYKHSPILATVSFCLETVSPQPERWIQACSDSEPGPYKVVWYEISDFGVETAPCKNRDGTNPCLKVFMNIKCKSVWRSHSIKMIFPSFCFKGFPLTKYLLRRKRRVSDKKRRHSTTKTWGRPAFAEASITNSSNFLLSWLTELEAKGWYLSPSICLSVRTFYNRMFHSKTVAPSTQVCKNISLNFLVLSGFQPQNQEVLKRRLLPDSSAERRSQEERGLEA